MNEQTQKSCGAFRELSVASKSGFIGSGKLLNKGDSSMKLSRILLVCAVLFAMCSVSFAAEYWVIKRDGKLIIVESKPAEAAIIVKGPFTTRAEAEVIVTNPPSGVVVTPGPPGPPLPPPPVKPVPVPVPVPAPPAR